MAHSALFMASVGALLAITQAAHATVACAVTATGAQTVTLFGGPDETSEALRDVPLGDLVFYPDSELAPTHAEGWVWVRHDMTQTKIWQSGIYGWMRTENIVDCG